MVPDQPIHHRRISLLGDISCDGADERRDRSLTNVQVHRPGSSSRFIVQVHRPRRTLFCAHTSLYITRCMYSKRLSRASTLDPGMVSECPQTEVGRPAHSVPRDRSGSRQARIRRPAPPSSAASSSDWSVPVVPTWRRTTWSAHLKLADWRASPGATTTVRPSIAASLPSGPPTGSAHRSSGCLEFADAIDHRDRGGRARRGRRAAPFQEARPESLPSPTPRRAR